MSQEIRLHVRSNAIEQEIRALFPGNIDSI